MPNLTNSMNYKRLIDTLEDLYQATIAYGSNLQTAAMLIKDQLGGDDASMKIAARTEDMLPHMQKIKAIIDDLMPKLKSKYEAVKRAEDEIKSM